MKSLKFFSALSVLIFMVACSSKKNVPTFDDLHDVEATANAALSLARLDSLKVATALSQLDLMTRQLDIMDSTFVKCPLPK